MDQTNRLLALQAGNRFLIGVAYRFVFKKLLDHHERTNLLALLRDPKERIMMMGGGTDAESLLARSEIGKMINADLDSFADRLDRPQITN